MSNELSDLILQLRDYQPIGKTTRPSALGFINDYIYFVTTLENINKMIGLESIKNQIAVKVKSFMVNYRRSGRPTNNEKLHTLLFGPSGCGKTQLGRYLSELWATSGCLPQADNTPIFTNSVTSSSQILPNIRINPELTSIQQNLVARETQLKQLQERTRNIQIQVNNIITSFNNVRKKVKAKDSTKEGCIQAKFQNIKRGIRMINSPIMISNSAQLLPVIIPKISEVSSFGSVVPPTIMNEIEKSTRTPIKFSVVTRGDLIGKYQGHTTDKVRTVLQNHIGGVLMIDEAYDLITSGQDDFGREILTEIINFMTTWPNKIIFIFAGYRKEMEETILKYQPGLARRFNWNFEITGYTSDELCKIFIQQLEKDSWKIPDSDNSKLEKFFKRNVSNFPHYGGDTERLCSYVKDYYYKDSWKKALDDSITNKEFNEMFNTIDVSIIKTAFDIYLDNLVKDKDDLEKIGHMYT